MPITKQLIETYLPAQFDHTDYPLLVPESAPVDTIAVGSVMAVFAWPAGQERYKKVARFVDAFFGRFQLFMQPPRHPKWKDVNLAAQVPGWTRFAAAQEWLCARPRPALPVVLLQKDFEGFLARIGQSALEPDDDPEGGTVPRVPGLAKQQEPDAVARAAGCRGNSAEPPAGGLTAPMTKPRMQEPRCCDSMGR